MLEQNWREGETGGRRYAYTCPSPDRYPYQWYWDSCFAAIAWRRFDPARSRAELESLLSAARPDGFIGHTIFWEPLRGARSVFYNRVAPGDLMTASIQPPLLAWAWQIAVGDPREVPGLMRHMDWLADNRDIDGGGLLWIVQPDESGLDASPKFDAVWGWQAQGLPGFPLLVRRNRRLGYDARRVLAKGGPVVCEVVTNVLYGLSQLAVGRPSLTPTLVERLYDEERGLFRDLVLPARERPQPVTWAALAPLALPDLPEAIARRHDRGAPAGPRSFLACVPATVGIAGGAGVLAGRDPPRPPALLARTDLGERGLAPVARTQPARLFAGGRAGAADGRCGRRGGSARVLRPANRRGDGRARLRVVHARARAGGPDSNPSAGACVAPGKTSDS